MKKLVLSSAIVAISIASYKKADAQLSLQINIGGVFSATVSTAPTVPVVAASDYYYYNDINCYYDVANNQYIYPENGAWYYSSVAPVMFSNYDFRNSRRTVMDRKSFEGRNIRPTVYNRQAIPNNNGYNNTMNQNRFAQQNRAKEPQMQQRNNQQAQRSMAMNNNGGNSRGMGRRGGLR